MLGLVQNLVLGLVQNLVLGLVQDLDCGASAYDGPSSIRNGYKRIDSFLVGLQYLRSFSSRYWVGADNRDDWIVCGGTKGVSTAGIRNNWQLRQEGEKK